MDVLLIDDHPILHRTIGALVGSVAPKAAFQAVPDLAGGIARAKRARQLALVLLDLGLPGCSGMQALARFRRALPRARVAVISATEDAASVQAALQAGVAGYLPKTLPPQVMVDALRLILDGGTYIPPQAMDARPAAKGLAKLAELGLSERQLEVARLLAQGPSNAEIAERLGLAESTVKQHAHAVFRALGVETRTQAAVALARMGIKL